jgi:predicted HicB family RNase H-like nuclease
MGAKYTEAQKNASIKYLRENTDDIRIRVPKGKKEEYKALAEQNGMSLNALIIELLEQKIKGR